MNGGDIQLHTRGDATVVTITANELKPQRNAALDQWRWEESSLRPLERRMAELGDETRARQLMLWKTSGPPRILTIGFVHRDEQILGQILDWTQN